VKRWATVLICVCAASGILVTALHTRSTPRPTPLPVEHRWDVIGTVKRVDFAKNYKTQPKTITMSVAPELNVRQSGASTFTVGPERIHLTDGRVLRVPAHTPGANACIELMTKDDKIAVTGLGPPDGLLDRVVRNYGPRNWTCVIVAALDAHGLVTRFSVLDTTDKLVANKGLASVRGVVARRGGRYLTESGYAFPLDPHATGDCTPDKISLSEHRPNEALIDSKRKTIVEIDCLRFA
jgi:hypothetical protein